jgi:hypothetical protein
MGNLDVSLAMNLFHPTIEKPEISVTVMGEPLAALFVASVIEFPGCRVQAETKAAAIAGVRQQLSERLGKAEFEVVTVPMVNGVDNPWLEMFGAFRDSVYFDDVVKIIEADRAVLGDEDVDPSVYQPIESA